MNSLRYLLVITILLLAFAGIGWVFWQQELVYLKPTPVPAGYKPVPANTRLHLEPRLGMIHTKPRHLHFYNPACPCSKFNLNHFITLTRKYERQVEFYVVIPSEKYLEEVKEKFGTTVPVIIDKDEKMADTYGVYSTPQAVVIDTAGKLYYRGNYNKSRYCTAPQSDYARMALDSLLAGRPAPMFNQLATTSYGCGLKEKENSLNLNF